MKHEVVWLPISEPVPYESNAKTHPVEQIDRLSKMILKGFDQPLVLDKDKVIIKGHGRLLAAKKLGMKEVPCIIRTDLTEDEVIAHRLGDNKNAESPWDMAFAIPELNHLYDKGFDMDVSGFFDWKPTPIDDPLVPQCDEDEVPEAVEPIAKRGQVWKLGRHRLMCGDSTSSEDAGVLMAGSLARMVHTDPPYNVDYSNADRPKAGKTDFGVIKNDAMGSDDFKSFLHLVYQNIDAYTQPDCAIYIWYASSMTLAFYGALEGTGIEANQMLIWKKPMLLGRSRYQWAHEPCLFAVKGKPFHTEDRTKTTVWDFGGYDKSKNVHPTQKPVFLPEEAISNSSESGDSVLDLFGGSGSTLIACEKTNRTCFMMELDPHYCDVIIARWEKYTGQKAEREVS